MQSRSQSSPNTASPNTASPNTASPHLPGKSQSASETSESVSGASYWAYLMPMFSFLLLSEVSSRVSPSYSLPMLILRIFVPLSILVYFARRGDYPELRISIGPMTIVDILVGVALSAMWMAPYLIFPNLRPDESNAFDPKMAGQTLVPLVLTLRGIGYAITTPWMEELFMRSFLPRYVKEFDSDDDFQSIPIAKFTIKSFVVIVAVFLATHMLWEWWVMLPWAILTMLWFYYRRDLFALIVVHAATNAAILITAIGWSDTMPLWYFV